MGHGNDLGCEPSPTGVQHPLLDLRQAGEIGARDFLQRALDSVEARVPFGCRAAQRRTALDHRRPLRAARIAQKRFARGRFADGPVAGQKRFGLACREGMALGGVGQANLFALARRAQGQRDRQGQAAAIQSVLKLRGQSAKDRQATLDPKLAAAQKLSDRRQRQLVLVG